MNALLYAKDGFCHDDYTSLKEYSQYCGDAINKLSLLVGWGSSRPHREVVIWRTMSFLFFGIVKRVRLDVGTIRSVVEWLQTNAPPRSVQIELEGDSRTASVKWQSVVTNVTTRCDKIVRICGGGKEGAHAFTIAVDRPDVVNLLTRFITENATLTAGTIARPSSYPSTTEAQIDSRSDAPAQAGPADDSVGIAAFDIHSLDLTEVLQTTVSGKKIPDVPADVRVALDGCLDLMKVPRDLRDIVLHHTTVILLAGSSTPERTFDIVTAALRAGVDAFFDLWTDVSMTGKV